MLTVMTGALILDLVLGAAIVVGSGIYTLLMARRPAQPVVRSATG